MLVIAALAPTTWPALWTLLLSCSARWWYALVGHDESPLWWLTAYRGVLIFGFPLAALGVWVGFQRLAPGLSRRERLHEVMEVTATYALRHRRTAPAVDLTSDTLGP